MAVHIFWIVTTPRLPAGLLTAQAWDVLRAGHQVFAAVGSRHLTALRNAGIEVTEVDPQLAAATLLEHGGCWIATSAEEEPVSRDLSERITADPSAAIMEITFGSWDPPGARLLDAVAIIDRLRSPGGCPWDRDQTHASVAPFLLEEAYETIDAIASGDMDHLREELGDLLMQPLFHARFAEDTEDGFSIDDVAGDAVDKLVRRHPHVFDGEAITSADGMPDTWEALKRREKPDRKYAVDGVVAQQPALSLAAKFLSRTANAGVDVPLPSTDGEPASEEAFGAALLTLVDKARQAGIDPELALRQAALAYADKARKVEGG